MQSNGLCKRIISKALVFVLSVALVFTMMPLGNRAMTYAAESELTVQTPVLVATGTDLVGDYQTAEGVSKEKSWTLNELKGLDGVRSEMYSAKQQKYPYTKSYNIVDGVMVSSLIGDLSQYTDVGFYASDGYAATFKTDAEEYNYENPGTKNVAGLVSGRYYYDGFDTANPTKEVPVVISWAFDRTEGSDEQPPTSKPTAVKDQDYLRLFCGQLASPGLGSEDMNGQLFNGNSPEKTLNKVIAGSAIKEVVLTVGSQEYTRADVLMLDFAERSYTYQTKAGEVTDAVRGVPFSVLLKGQDDDAVVSFAAADGYDMSSATKTVKELVDGNYMLAYQVNGNGVYETAKAGAEAGYGYLTMYGDGDKPAKMINKVTVTSGSGIDFSTSPYKHITNGGQEGSGPYNIDAITGATLTVEGPGVKTSVPVSVRDLEGRDAGAARAVYTDKREGSDVTRMYEGIDLYYILTGMTNGENGIKMTDKARKVLIKNRNRNTIAEFTVDQVEEAHATDTPILVAYGTSMPDGTNIRPFVFDNGAGADRDLGNEDGCIKLVYNKNAITDDANTGYTTFGNMAYIYVAEAETPGYKHDKAPYESPDISNYIITITGDKIGREVNYTVQQLENMVAYNDEGVPDNSGMGYRDEYSLANSTYWYVNEYEGVQLWKLLLKSGLDPALANDEETIVSSTATDGYAATDKFTVKQVADPDSFGFYEKNPADLNDGTYEGNESIRQGDDVSTGDKLRVGYPVLIAYGVNGYPYVEKSSQDGYLSGLQNDGGPMRVISGKLKYNHANGSNQAKYLDKIIVGDNSNHYSTHKYHSDDVYKGLAEDNTLEVKILNGADADAPVMKTQTYKVGDIEDYIYGGKLTTNLLKEAKIKTFYQLTKGSSSYSDLYEGIDLNFFLKNIVELPGYKGTITFGNGTSELSLSLEDVLATNNGSNTETGMSGLAPVLAYGKNGAPMVADKNAEGYQNKITLAEGTDYENSISVKNDGGPLAVLFPHTDSSVSDQSLTNVTSITINLSADKYAHTAAPYDAYADYAVTISGEGTRLGTEGKDFALSELEGKQTIAFTGDYSILKSGDGQTPSQTRYRGINLYSLLTSSAVGLKSNADKVVVTTSDGESKEFTLSQIRKADYVNSVTGANDLPVILAYGVGKAGEADKEDGVPLVAEKTSEGYDSAYGNNGGPVRLVVGQTDAEDVNSGSNLKYVKSIEVTASEMTSWNHNSSEVYKQYRNENVQLVVNDKEGNELFNKTFTVGEIEDNDALVERTVATVVQEFTWEGINFWKWVKQEAGDAADLSDPVSVTVSAADGFSQEIRAKFGIDGLENGIKDGDNRVPILLAYGVGGYPLVIGDKSHADGEGYDATAGNNGGPLRLVTHNSQGTSLTYVTKITVVAGEGGSQPEEPADFTIKGLKSGDIKLSIDDIKNLKNKAGDIVGAAEGEYVRKGVTKKVKGALLKNILAANDIDVESTIITLNTPDGFETTEKGASYNNITLKQAIDQDYFLAYQEWDAEANEWKDIADTVKGTDIVTNLRMYRHYCDATEGVDSQNDWYDECTNITAITLDVPEVTEFKEYSTSGGVRSTWMDKDGTIWVGTYGGGLYSKKAGEDAFSVMNTSSEPALKTDFTSAVAADAEGGIWVSQNASYTEPGNNQGVLYIKGDEITQYTVENNPGTIPNNYVQAIKVDTDGTVWMGSFGGVTIYDPAEGTWKTYSKADTDFPATSVCTITLDGSGGAWLGFYPDGSGTEAEPYAGGFCHIDKDGTVTKKVSAGGPSAAMFAQSWVRSIAIDQKGTVWAVAAGTNIEDNVGGVIWKWQSSKEEPTRYTGDEVLGDYLDGSNTTEVRVVAVDKDGSLWFGTSADGVLKVDNPKLNAEGKMDVTAQYAKETGSWSAANMNNVYSIDFWNDGTAYVGTSGGLMVLGDEPEGEGAEPAGDVTPEEADLTITGDALARDGYFSIRGIKNAEGINKLDINFDWQNSGGETGTAAVQGATLENIFRDVIGMKEGTQVDSVELISADGYKATYTAEQALSEDLAGNKAMFIWKEDGANVQKVIRGQFTEGEANKSRWARDVVKIVVHAKAQEPAPEEAVIEEITALPDATNITLDDAEAVAFARLAYDALSDEEKAKVTNYDKLVEAEAAIEKAVIGFYNEEAEELIDGLDFSDYSAANATALYLKLTRLESKIKEAETASEAALLYAEMEDAIANTRTLLQNTMENLNEFPVEVTAKSAGYNKIKLTWHELTSARSYTIYRSTDPNGEFKEIAKIQRETYVDAGLKTGTKYYYKVIPGAKVKGEYVYGNPSKTVKAAPVLAKPKVTLKAGSKKATITWNKVAGANGYVIYRSTKKASGFKAIKTIKKGGTVKAINKNLKANKTYYYKIKAYRNVDGKKVFSKFSAVKKVKIKK